MLFKLLTGKRPLNLHTMKLQKKIITIIIFSFIKDYKKYDFFIIIVTESLSEKKKVTLSRPHKYRYIKGAYVGGTRKVKRFYK